MAAHVNVLTATASDLQAGLSNGTLSSRDLVKIYLYQISRYNGYLKAVIAVAPEKQLIERAAELDRERADGRVRGPLHGVPIIIKDNIDTSPETGMPTTCGSLAMVGSKPRKNAVIFEKLREAGAIVLGKANLSEWSWSRSDFANSGWSAVGGQTQSPYVRGGFRDDDSNGGHSNPGGSSSGSAVAVAAGFSPISIGTDTTGSIIVPGDRAALYTMKPTNGIVSSDGIIPVTYELDSAGPLAKSALDLANLLDVMVDPSKTTVPGGGYTTAVTGSWDGIRIGIVEPEKWLFPTHMEKYEKEVTDQMLREWKAAHEKLETLAAKVTPVTLISLEEVAGDESNELRELIDFPLKANLDEYFASVDDCKMHKLEDVVEFNKKHSEEELPPGADNQNGFLRALNPGLTHEEYQNILSLTRSRCGKEGIDKVLEEHEVDVIFGPGNGLMMRVAGLAGYPSVTVPLGYSDFNGRAFGMQVIAKAHQEDLLIRVQSAWESTFPKRQPPMMEKMQG